MQMGVRNGPAVFQPWINAVLHQLPLADRDAIRDYQDDIIVATPTEAECRSRFNRLLVHLRQFGATPNEQKCIPPREGAMNVNRITPPYNVLTAF